MKRLADYKDEAAFELLADIIEPMSVIFADKGLKEVWGSPKKIDIAKYVFTNHKKSAIDVMRAIDSETEITPISIIKCILDLVIDVQNDPVIKDFFTYAEQASEANAGSGSAMESTEDGAN